RALRDARLLQRPAGAGAAAPAQSGGGFLLEQAADPRPPRPPRAAPAPLQPPDQPACLECGERFPSSYLLDAFDYDVCDSCRDPDGAHALLTRTEAKAEFLLQDCDLDGRQPPLRCVRRPNPHARARSDMRLYLRAQVEARALAVWGSAAALLQERAARGQRRERARAARGARRLRALRMDVRSSLYSRERAPHEHRWGPERPGSAEDSYSHTCLDCGHVETYEKM
ncbi:DNA repair protein complementing XP-A cells homolog, partial [Pectinophora gossypiella]|uniref:DNA repair protein complementing XP-A cells homolog n=1 Tax=Pectinophora gossypiella TaxID=13191 RepID=UPI00214EEC77